MITQETFDKVVTGLAAQNWEQSSAHGECKFRGPNNLSCAIGQLIPDDQYDPIMDIQAYELSDFQDLGLLQELTDDDFADLQWAHDGAHSSAHMQNNFQRLANVNDLRFSP